MSHDTHHSHSKENKTIISFKNSFWLVIILVFLFIAALNFVQAESAGEGEGGHEATTHETHGAKSHEATEGHATEAAGHEAAEAPKEAEAEHK